MYNSSQYKKIRNYTFRCLTGTENIELIKNRLEIFFRVGNKRRASKSPLGICNYNMIWLYPNSLLVTSATQEFVFPMVIHKILNLPLGFMLTFPKPLSLDLSKTNAL